MRTYKVGAAALPTVLAIAAIVLIAGVGVLGAGLIEDALTYGEKESREALYAAETGVHDAIERLVRNMDCNIGGSPTCAAYSLAVGDASVYITVSGSASPKTIIGTATRGNKQRRIQAIVTSNTNNKIIVSSWVELTD